MSVETEVTTHQVALSFEDGVTRFITCRADQTVADASYRQRINIPLDCRDGACGTCKALCESGEYDGGIYIDDALPDDEAAQGYVLPCSMRPKSDLVLQIAGTSELAKTSAATYTGTITALRELSSTTVEVAVVIPNRSELAFLPGQYVNIAVPGTDESRSYSFSNAPHEQTLTFLIKLTPGGVMSEYIAHRAAVGDELTFTGPHGSFFLRDTERPVMLLAGGTGLAPILSMLRKMKHDESVRFTHLIYGVSTDDDLVALDQIAEVAAGLPAFGWDYCVADPASTAPNKGYVTGLMKSEDLYDGDVAIYLCGPPAMVEAVRTHVNGVGIAPTGFYYEKFALASTAASTETAADDSVNAPIASTKAITPLELLLESPEARMIAGQEIYPLAETAAWTSPITFSDHGDAVRRIAGQLMGMPADRTAGPTAVLDDDAHITPVGSARSIAGQQMFPGTPGDATAPADVAAPAVADAPVTATAPDGYQIGEEHPDVRSSDALFEARQALELGALELTIGRLSSQQLAGYRLLAEATLPYVDGFRFTDAAAYTETNANFHDYLFAQTGNAHLLQAYQALGVKARMADVLRNATWCHPRCAIDHVEIVEAFEAGDRVLARQLISDHAERSKQTMRRAMVDTMSANRPRFVTPGRFAGKVVVITGAAQGIGAQVARRIAAEGGELVLADRSEIVHEVSDELTSQGTHVAPVICDLESYDGAAALVEAALTRYGRIDVLINNVGGAINFKPFTEFTDQEIQAEITRSLMTTLFSCRAVLPSMVEAGSGVIVNVSSAATRGIHRIPYSAAKGGINAITASLAVEYADAGIRVVATAPGGTEAPPRRISRGTPEPRNDQERDWFQAHIDQTLASSLMSRYGTLDEQAAAITFLASDEATYITGSVLPVAGGDLG